MSTSIRGDKGSIRILKNGQPVPILEIVSIDFAEESQQTKTYYCGRRDPETDVLPMGWNGSLTVEVKNDALDALMQEIDEARRAGVASPAIAILIYEAYPDGTSGSGQLGLAENEDGRATIFTDVQLTYSNRRQGGVQEKIMKTLSFSASRKILQ